MKNTIPNKEVLSAFDVLGEPIRLEGGQGACYRVGDVVLKPIDDHIEADWYADLNNDLVSDSFRVPKFIRTSEGSAVVDGWIAYEFLEGKHNEGKYTEAFKVSKVFHEALLGIPRPDFFDTRKDVWSVADRIAWGELPLPDFDLTNEPLKRIFSRLRKNELPNQLMHGDWGTGNILFDDKLPPAVIDFSPYWRPADFSVAVMIIDALVWEGADTTIIDLGKDIKDFDQLLWRGLVRRICEVIGHQNHPENDKDRSGDIIKHLDFIEVIEECL